MDVGTRGRRSNRPEIGIAARTGRTATPDRAMRQAARWPPAEWPAATSGRPVRRMIASAACSIPATMLARETAGARS
jgi:hypothetical protein